MNNAKNTCLVLLSLFLTSCVSLAWGTHETLSIDSKPRGVLVETNEKSPKQVTPFFLETRRASKHSFILENNEQKLTQTVSCNFRWWPMLFGNAPLLVFFPYSLITYGAGIGEKLSNVVDDA